MYMYYLLGYRIVKECQTMVKNHLKNQKDKITTWGDTQSKRTGIGGKSEIFQMLNEEVRFKVSIYWLHAVVFSNWSRISALIIGLYCFKKRLHRFNETILDKVAKFSTLYSFSAHLSRRLQ